MRQAVAQDAVSLLRKLFQRSRQELYSDFCDDDSSEELQIVSLEA